MSRSTGQVPIGVKDGRIVAIPWAAFERHWLTTGPTGLGKTTTVLGRILHGLAHPEVEPTRYVVVDPRASSPGIWPSTCRCLVTGDGSLLRT